MTFSESARESDWLQRLWDAWQDVGGQALAKRGSFHIAISPSDAPLALVRHLAQKPWPWSATQIYLTDERCLPPSHKESAYHTVFDAFYPVKPRLHRWATEFGDYQRAATEYEHLLKRETGDPPKLDLVILDLGPDGRTAGLLPGSPALQEAIRACALNHSPAHPARRLTLTYPALHHARALWFLTRGTHQGRTARLLAEGNNIPALPASPLATHPAPALVFHCAA